MKRELALLAVVLVSACASVPQSDEYSEIAVAIAPECDESSAVIRELRDANGREIRTKKMPVRVLPGVYSIGVSCGTLFDSSTSGCRDTSATSEKNDVAPYELVLQPKKRYLFSCGERKGLNVIRLQEAAL